MLAFHSLISFPILLTSLGVHAAPARVLTRQATSVTTLSSTQLASFAPFTQFARAAYCPPDKIQGWQCGAACNALPGFNATLTGGDGDAEQFFFVGHWPAQNAVVVAHQGTDPTQFMSVLTDATFLPENLNTTLFPGVPSGVQAHSGFLAEHAKSASVILAEVKQLLSDHGSNNVILIGHSLGGALAELDQLFMKLNLPSDVTTKGVTYGTPRVGNPAFSTFFDSMVPDFTRVNNEKDLIPILPGQFLGFLHPAGETHIISPGNAVACPGPDDSTDPQCTDKTVPTILDGDILNHLGPYEGINIGTLFCTP